MAITAKIFLKGQSGSSGLSNYKLTAKNFLPSGVSPTYSKQTSGVTQASSAQATQSNEKTNNGGFFGGIGYTLEKLGVGFVSFHEGILDMLGSGFAKLIGNDEWAEDIIANDWFNYSHPEEWYNPGGGWQTAGDVSHGIGWSVPGIVATVLATKFTAGSATPAVVSFTLSGLGAAGRGTKEAYDQTGELTGKEYGYGLLTGITEGAIEAVSNKVGIGSGVITKNAAKLFGKEIAEEAVKDGIVKAAGKAFAGEALEEMTSTYLDPYFKRATYDPTAKNASAEEIVYSGLVGGLSGMIMEGGNVMFSSTYSYVRGNKIASDGGLTDTLDTANNILFKLGKDAAESEIFKDITAARNRLTSSLKSTGGEVKTLEQKKMLGDLSIANFRAAGTMFISKRALNIVANAETIAQRLTAYGYKDANGKALQFSAEDLTRGFDPEKPSSILKALKENSALRSVAVADAAGAMIMDTAKATKSLMNGEALASQIDINRFAETATKEEIKAVSEALKIDDWRTLTRADLAKKLSEYIENGGVQQNLKVKKLKEGFKATPISKNHKIPKIFIYQKDGIRRYSDGKSDIGISKEGDVYRIYDYQTESMTKELSKTELNDILKEYDGERLVAFESARQRLADIEAMQKENAEIEEYTRTNIKDYVNLSAPAQSQIRRIVREGRAKGVSDSDVLMYAKVAAHSGIDIVFDKGMNYRGTNEQGEDTYSDGFYSASRNTIFVNPEALRTQERLLIHELDHAIRTALGKNGRNVTKTYKYAVDGVSEDIKKSIKEKYGDDPDVNADEANAYYAEIAFSNKHVLEKLIEAEPTLKEKILSFFKGASEDYADVPKLSGAAKRYYRTYKKLFDEFSARNSEAFVNEKSLTSMNQENMQVSDRQYAVVGNQQTPIYDFKKSFAEQVDDYDKGKVPEGDSLLIGATPDVFKSVGLNALPMTINQTHVDYALHGTKDVNHHIGDSLLKQLPEALKKPVAIITSRTSNTSSLVAILSMTHNGNQVNVPVYIDGYGFQNGVMIDSNAITSVYARENAITTLLTNAIKNEAAGKIGVYYWDKKRATTLLSNGKVSMPNILNTLSDGSIHSILENGSPVKPKLKNITESQQFKRWFGDWQKHPDNASKVVNADGTPKILYHQTGEDFTVFDPRHKGSGSNDDGTPFGIFMKPEDNDIGLKGKKQMALYAKIVKPLVANDRQQLEYELKKMSHKYAELMQKQKALTAEYQKKLEDAEKAWSQYAKDYRAAHPEATRSEIYKDKTFSKLFDAEDILTEEWIEKADALSTEAKEEITRTLKKSGYDGVILKKDAGSGGRTVETYIALEPEQVKSATDNIGTFSKYEKDIQYALPIEYESNNQLATRPLDGEVVNQSSKDGNIAKIKAQVFSDKAYNKSDVKKAFSNMRLAKVLSAQTIDDLTNEVWIALNEAGTEEKRTKVVREAINKVVNYTDEQLRNSEVLLEKGSTMQDLVTSLANEFKTLLDSGKQTYKGKLEEKAEKAKARIKKRAESRADEAIKRAEAKMEARYKTDTEFSQQKMVSIFNSSELLKKMNRTEKARLIKDFWYDLSRSNSDWERFYSALKFRVKLRDAMEHDANSEFARSQGVQREAFENELDRVSKEILKAGRKSFRAKLADDVRGEVKEQGEFTRNVLTKIYQATQKISDEKTHRYAAASDYKGNVFRGSIESLSKIDWRGKFSAKVARKEFAKLREWYNKENPMFKDQQLGDISISWFDTGIADRLDFINSSDKDSFTNAELEAASEVLSYFANVISNYDKAYIEGRWQDAEPIARKMREAIVKQDKTFVPPAVRMLRNDVLSGGARTFADPESIMKLADGYDDGILTTYYNELVNAEVNAQSKALDIKAEYDDFMKSNPKFLKGEMKNTVKIGNAEVARIDLVEYAMLLKREGAWMSIAEGGVVFTDVKKKNDVRVYPIESILAKIPSDEKGREAIYEEMLKKEIKRVQEQVNSMLTKSEKKYIGILEKGYEAAREIKAEGDMKLRGVISVVEGYYYPMRHADSEHLSDFDVAGANVDKFSNASFNKHVVDGAKSALRIRSADSTFNAHVKAVTGYANISPVVDSFNKVFKLKFVKGEAMTKNTIIEAGREDFTSVQRTMNESKSAWRDKNGKLVGIDYLQNLIQDTMGKRGNVGDGFWGTLRGNAVTFSLGLNPKVLITQTSSLLASTAILQKRSLVKSAFIWNGGMDKYSQVARIRNSDYTVAKAAGVINEISRRTQIFTAGITLFDRLVVYRAWAACQAEVAAKGGPKIGTEENRIKAGQLLDQIILKTQQSTFATQKTEGARRGGDIVKSMLMFKSDSIKLAGRVIDGWGEWAYTKALLKNATEDERATLEKKLKEAKKKTLKAVNAVTMNAVFAVAIAEIFRKFHGKDKDESEEEKAHRLGFEFVGNLLSGSAVFSEIYSWMTSDYGLDSMEYSAINGVIDTSKAAISYAEKVISGTADERERNKLIENTLYSLGQLTGVPFRNVKNTSRGVINWFDKELVYKWDDALYKQNYSKDLNEALSKGDDERAMMIMELALGEKLGSGFDEGSIRELARLVGMGESVLPTAISDTLTVNGEEIVLSGEALSAVRSEYSKVVDVVNGFVDSGYYKALTEEQKAKAIRKLYSSYKNIAYDAVLGTDKSGNAGLVSRVVSADAFNSYLTLSVLESDVDKNGKTVAGSKRAKVVKAIGELGVSPEERLLLICASGYTLKDGDIRGLSAEKAKRRLLKYILKLKGVSAAEKAEIAEMCGFEVKNGKIIMNSQSGQSKDTRRLPKLKI